MQEDVSALARKYRDEMLRLYGGNMRPSAPAEPAENSTPADEIVETPPPMPEAAPEPLPLPMPEPEVMEPMMPPEEPIVPRYEEPVLPDYIREGAELPEILREEKWDDGYTYEGKLQVIAAAGDGAFPVPGATVTVYRRHDGKEHLMYTLLTDDSGATPVISLPAPSAALSQEPGNVQPFAVYDIRILKNGFFRVLAEEVPVFAGITSRQGFRMIPLPLTVHEDVETIVFPGGRADL